MLIRRVIQSIVAITLLTSALSAVACCGGGYDYTKEDLSGYNLQPNFKVNDDSEYARDGKSVYLYGGYLYMDRFLTTNSQSATNGSSTITYSPKTSVPDVFSGFEVGFGKELTRHIDLQMGYLQTLKQTRHSTIGSSASSISARMNGVQAAIGYVFNPDDEFQVMAKLGALVYETNETILVGSTSYTPDASSVKINPTAGVEALFQVTKKVAVRVSVTGAVSTYSSATRGELYAMGGLSYIL